MALLLVLFSVERIVSNKMKTIAIIAEYNPFHNGHAWQIETAKEETGADRCIVIMSPDYVQRGEPAIIDKYTRTRMALSCGADVVLELPVRYALASAQGFARGGVGILNALGCVDVLVFGCETDAPALLDAAAGILVREPEGYRTILAQELRKGVGFAAAREKALLGYIREGLFEENPFDPFGSNTTPLPIEALADALANGFLHQPNNILGLEYCIALQWMQSRIMPYAIRRRGAGYHDVSASIETSPAYSGDEMNPSKVEMNPSKGLFLSATGIRKMLREKEAASPASSSASAVSANPVLPAVPGQARSILKTALKEKGVPSLQCYSTLLHYALLRCTFEDPCNLSDAPCEPDLLARICRLLPQYRDAALFADDLTSRQFPLSTVNRALLRLFLGLSQKECTPTDPAFPDAYVRILGFRKEVTSLLHELTRSSAVPVITKPAAAANMLNKKQLTGFEADVNASHLYQLLFQDRVKGIVSEYTRSPIIIT